MTYDLNRLIKWCVGVTGIFILSEVIYGIHSGMLYQFFSQVEDGTLSGADQDFRAVEIDFWGVIVGVGSTVAVLVAFIVNGIWVYRASVNAKDLDPDPNRISPAMAVIWYAVPFANLVMPFKSMKQTYNSSLHPSADLNSKVPGYFGWWWAAWVISTTLVNVSTQIFIRDDGLEALQMASLIDMIATPISIMAAVLFIKIMKTVTELQANNAGNANAMAEVFE
ncbi:DUF4328 domain-containing protein [Parasulfitobacter algicola]|uniref:DUF4328 domain-containing protein n=1 Tax=Parasulfitobacter algicola TaxID=2614809 RepID=A0ABX2INV7_9RHOB|nr:DUF4328 domain-containing protein [Sulfitobacter algicola]NSX54035.1 DUF4328 domain-containing protein [Sulfitobacter algicola]